MKTLTREIKVEAKLAKIIQSKMNKNQSLDENTRRNSRVDLSLTANFGEGIEVDIKVIDTDNGPYVDAILFDEGSEQMVLEPQYVLLGKYPFEHNDKKYVVTVR